ncbi:MAG: Fic family protein [Candidatus Pacebacteria bacterium]|nr:Fic family protein [Candidatus Paceibacterota bacterium]
MVKLTSKQEKIAIYILKRRNAQASEVFKDLIDGGEKVSLITVKRDLSEMSKSGVLSVSGSGRSVSYGLSLFGRIFFDVDTKAYCSIDLDDRYGFRGYDFDLFSSIPNNIFDDDDLMRIERATESYKSRVGDVSKTIQKRELERFVIEMSWKSSKIEGNTYTLLDTERLILENKKAADKTEKETQMILNHKEAFEYIHNHPAIFKNVSKKCLVDLHDILTKDLGIDKGLRKDMVGISGSIYMPLDNIYQIDDAVGQLMETISRIENVHAKALISLLGVSYIQPFNDGNKRVGRFIANAILLSYGFPPLSYRSVGEDEYREAILVFYELNSIIPFKKIFVSQYEFTTDNYTVL